MKTLVERSYFLTGWKDGWRGKCDDCTNGDHQGEELRCSISDEIVEPRGTCDAFSLKPQRQTAAEYHQSWWDRVRGK